MTKNDQVSPKSFKKYFIKILKQRKKLYKQLSYLLRKRNLNIAMAESCTGGLLASRIVSLSGSSLVFWGSVVCYGRDAKISLLNINERTLNTKGEVSAECALEMAQTIKRKANVSCAISVTGYAQKKMSEKPYAYAACLWEDHKYILFISHIRGSRNKVRGLLADVLVAFFIFLLLYTVPQSALSFKMPRFELKLLTY